jgi:hypothetical protein
MKQMLDRSPETVKETENSKKLRKDKTPKT